jgi:periodic tryptophan protein 2
MVLLAAARAGAADAGTASGQASAGCQARAIPAAPAGGSWALTAKHYFNQRGAKVSACDYHRASGLLVVGYTSGLFDLHQLPDFSNIHTLSISRERITAMTFNQVTGRAACGLLGARDGASRAGAWLVLGLLWMPSLLWTLPLHV